MLIIVIYLKQELLSEKAWLSSKILLYIQRFCLVNDAPTKLLLEEHFTLILALYNMYRPYILQHYIGLSF